MRGRLRHDRRALSAQGFEITSVLVSPPPLTSLPAVYLDETSSLWAVAYPLQPPVIHALSDVRACSSAEDLGEGDEGVPSGRPTLDAVLLHPRELSRRNAARRGLSLGIGVRVLLADGATGETAMSIPLCVSAARRGSRAHRSLMSQADGLARALSPAPAAS